MVIRSAAFAELASIITLALTEKLTRPELNMLAISLPKPVKVDICVALIITVVK